MISSNILDWVPRCPGHVAIVLVPLGLVLMLLVALYILFEDWYFREPIEPRFASPMPKPKPEGRKRKNVAWWDDKAGGGKKESEGMAAEDVESGEEEEHAHDEKEKGWWEATGEHAIDESESKRENMEDRIEDEHVLDDAADEEFDERGRLRYRSPSPDTVHHDEMHIVEMNTHNLFGGSKLGRGVDLGEIEDRDGERHT
jgi:hypothetical protein